MFGLLYLCLATACSRPPDPNTVVMVIESSPAETFFSAPRTEEGRRFIDGELLV